MKPNPRFPMRSVFLIGLATLFVVLGSTFFGKTLRADFLVSDTFGNQVLRFLDDGTPYAAPFVAPGTEGLAGATGMVLDSNGNLLVASRDTNEILRFDITSGSFIDKITSTEINGPTHLGFVPGTETLLVANFGATNVGTSITAIDSSGSSTFTSGENGNEPQRVVSFIFGSNDDLYVSSLDGAIKEYSSAGVYDSEFASVPTSAGGLSFANNGDLLVANPGPPGFVIRFDASGVLADSFSTALPFLPDPNQSFPVFVMPSPLDNDELLVSLAGGGGVYRFDTSGNLIGAGPFLSGIQQPGEILHVPTAIPEPTMALPLVMGIGCIFLRRRRQD